MPVIVASEEAHPFLPTLASGAASVVLAGFGGWDVSNDAADWWEICDK